MILLKHADLKGGGGGGAEQGHEGCTCIVSVGRGFLFHYICLY